MLREGTKHTFTTIDRPVCVNDFQKLSQQKLPKELYDYVSSGADDEQTLNSNRDAWKHWYLRPRVLRSLAAVIDTRTILPWQQHALNMPVFVSPAGVQALMHQEGECAVARACENAGILFGLSQHATKSMEQVSSAAPQCLRYYQSYILKDRAWTWRLIERALKSGYQGKFPITCVKSPAVTHLIGVWPLLLVRHFSDGRFGAIWISTRRCAQWIQCLASAASISTLRRW